MKQNKKIKITESKLKDMIREAINELAPETYYSAGQKSYYKAKNAGNHVGAEDEKEYYTRKGDGLMDRANGNYGQINTARNSYLQSKDDYNHAPLGSQKDLDDKYAKRKEMDNAYRRYRHLNNDYLDINKRFKDVDNGTRVYNKDTHQWEDKPTTESLGESKLRKMIREAINELAPETYLSAAKEAERRGHKARFSCDFDTSHYNDDRADKLSKEAKDSEPYNDEAYHNARQAYKHARDAFDNTYKYGRDSSITDSERDRLQDKKNNAYRRLSNVKDKNIEMHNRWKGVDNGTRVYNKETHRWEDKPTTESLGESKLRNYIKSIVHESIKSRR